MSYLLGNGSTDSTPVRAPILVGQDTDWVAVSAGYSHTLALKTDGTLWAWGINNYGELGDGSQTVSRVPKQVGALNWTWREIAAGTYFSLAIKSDGTLWAWGYDGYGQLGIGDVGSSYQEIPVQIGTDSDWKKIAAGGRYAMAIKDNGSLWTWGDNTYGQLGDGTYTSRNTPGMLVNTDGHWLDIAAGVQGTSYQYPGEHSAGIKTDGTVWTWGHNHDGELGNGTVSTSNIPGQIMRYMMTPSAIGEGTVSPSSPQEVSCDATKTFTFTPGDHYHFDFSGGSCWQGSLTDNHDGSWSFVADESQIYENCTVIAIFSIDTYTLNYTAGDHGSINGYATQTIAYGGDGTMVTAVPETGYHFVSWSDGVTNASRSESNVTTDISVNSTFSINTSVVSAGVDAHGTLNASSAIIDYGSSASFTVTPAVGYTTDSAVGGDCPAGSWNGTVYTTGAVTGACSVSFTHTINSYTVNASVDAHGTLDASFKDVIHGSSASFTVTPAAGYTTDSAVGGDCPAGSWSGTTYTTGAVAGACSVSFTHTINTYAVNSSVAAGGNGGIAPEGNQTVTEGEILHFTLTPAPGYHLDQLTGTCRGILSGNIFTTYPIMANCTLVASFTDQYSLSITFKGNGSGTVTSNPVGIDSCTTDCRADFNDGTGVILSAAAVDEKNEFMGWSGDVDGTCPGTDPCMVTMDQARVITATFKGGFPWPMFLPAIIGVVTP